MALNREEDLVFDQQKLEEMYDDMFWRVAMGKYIQVEGEKLLKESEEARNDPHYSPSERATKQFNKMLNKFSHKRKLRVFMNKSIKILNKVGIIVLIFTIIFAISYTTVEAFRLKVLNFFLTFEKEYASVSLAEEEADGNITTGLSNTYAPTYIPEGYWIDNTIDEVNYKVIEYINDKKEIIRFTESNFSTITNIDTENAEIVKDIKINGVNGLFVTKNGKTTISWSMDNRIFVVSAQIREEEIVQIAESVIFIE